MHRPVSSQIQPLLYPGSPRQAAAARVRMTSFERIQRPRSTHRQRPGEHHVEPLFPLIECDRRFRLALAHACMLARIRSASMSVDPYAICLRSRSNNACSPSGSTSTTTRPSTSSASRSIEPPPAVARLAACAHSAPHRPTAAPV